MGNNNNIREKGQWSWAIHVILCGFLIQTNIAYGVDVPSTLTPGQIEQLLDELPNPKSQPPATDVLPTQPIPAPQQDSVPFTLKDVNFSGATVYLETELKAFFAELVGKTVTLNQLQSAAANAEIKYRNDGYVLAHVLIPKQTLTYGRLTVDVVEGWVDDVKFQGDKTDGFVSILQDYITKIKAVKPVRIDKIERYLLLMNDLPGLTAHGSLVPSQTQPGAADLVVEVSRKSFSGQIGFNNRLTKLLGTYRGEVYAEANNIIGLEEKTYARVYQSFEDKMTILSLGEDLPVFSEGTRLSFMLNQVWSKTSLFNITNGLNSNLVSFNVNLMHPLIRTRSMNLSLRGGFSMLDSTSKSDFFNEEITNDRIRSFRVGLTFDLADSWQGINIADLELSQGINALGARDPSDTVRNSGRSKLSAAQGQVDYVKVNLYLARLQSITPDWSFLAAFQGQFTKDVLLAPEQFSLGGEQFLRAYDPSEFIGDKGFATKAELRYTVNPFDTGSLMFYGFYDYGQIHFNSNRPSNSIGAAGVGMRVSVTPYFSGYIEGAKPLHPNQTIEQNKDMRLFGGIRLTF